MISKIELSWASENQAKIKPFAISCTAYNLNFSNVFPLKINLIWKKTQTDEPVS